MIIIGIIFGIIAGILNVIPYIGFIIAFILVYSYFYMFGGRSTGLIYASNLETRKTLKPTKESVKKAIMTDEAEKPAE
jgi:divalent metal cation (Fe/Co/Zn/Cd) transporter